MSDLHRYYARGEYGRHLGQQRELEEQRHRRLVRVVIVSGLVLAIANVAMVVFF